MVDAMKSLNVILECPDDAIGRQAAACLLIEQGVALCGGEISAHGIEVSVEKDIVRVGARKFTYPMRIGAVMEAVIAQVDQAGSGISVQFLDLRFRFSGYEFIGVEAVCVREEDGERVKLTDRERDVLAYLYMARDHRVSREELLEQIWGYSAEAETHTIETHIYRLRQKIEDDPSLPKIVVTQDDRYCLVMEPSDG